MCCCYCIKCRKEAFPIKEKTNNRPKLWLIRGRYPYEISHGSIRIVAAPKNRQPFPVDAVAVEEDTFLVLSADTTVREPRESLMRVMTRVIETRPETPGRVLVKCNHSIRFLAIVHDLNQDPSWREEWIRSALRHIFKEVENRRLKSLALPFLGTLHGSLDAQRFVVLLREALEGIEFRHLKQLWLVVSSRTGRHILETLKSDPQ